uniref:Uncharacterized protein n=1 Tax=Rhizophora mucronata TaxID=61149 RepID=A0A2P2QVZ7_RHIMU
MLQLKKGVKNSIKPSFCTREFIFCP